MDLSVPEKNAVKTRFAQPGRERGGSVGAAGIRPSDRLPGSERLAARFLPAGFEAEVRTAEKDPAA